MSATITYKGETVETLNGGEYVTLHTNGKALEDDIRVEVTEESGGAIPTLEGTAVPTGEVVKNIYLNLGLSAEEITAYLAQLTYVQTDLYEYPICPIFAFAASAYKGIFIFAIKFDSSRYDVAYCVDIANATSVNIIVNNDWRDDVTIDMSSWGIPCIIGALRIGYSSLSEWGGLSVGAENEKIKNVFSITPFLAQAEDDPIPTEVATEEEMTALLETAEIGAVYKYTGESGTYESGALYVVEESE